MRDPYDLTVWLGGPQGWSAVGTELSAGIRPEHFKARATRRGSDTCSFDLRRDPRLPQPDLAAWTPCEVEIAGVKVWKGQVKETPSSEGDDPVINVQGRGLPAHLDDEKYQAVYVHDRLTDYRDARSFLDANLADYTTGWGVDVGAGAISFTFAGPMRSAGGAPRAGVVLDTAVAGGVKALAIDWARSNPVWAGTAKCYVVVSDNLAAALAGSGAGTIKVLSGAGATSGTYFDNTVSGRYVVIFCDSNSGQDAAAFMRINKVQLFGDAAYYSGGGSYLRSFQIVADAVTRATRLLSDDLSRIEPSTFVLPSFVMDGLKTPGEVCDTANALENRLLAVDLDDRIVFRPLPDIAKWEIGTWAGAEFKDASLNSGDEIFNSVIVTGTAPDGTKVSVERTATIATAVDVQDFRRTQELAIRNTVTPAVAARIGDLWLGAHSTTPLKGDVQIVGTGGVRAVQGGAPVHPAWLLRDGGELLRLSDRTDPDTGAFGRDGRIDAIDYDHDSLTASLALDNDRRSIDALLERLTVVVGT